MSFIQNNLCNDKQGCTTELTSPVLRVFDILSHILLGHLDALRITVFEKVETVGKSIKGQQSSKNE